MTGRPLEARVGIAHMSEFSRSGRGGTYDDRDAISQAVRQALLRSGLGTSDPAIPLADLINEGEVVLVKPNFVKHINGSGRSTDCLITHPSVLLSPVWIKEQSRV